MFVWLASYPKSGNTWLRLLLDSLLKGGGQIDINAISLSSSQPSLRGPFDDALGISSSYLTGDEIDAARPRALAIEAATAAEPLFRKVHDAWRRTVDGNELFPKNLTRAAIYIVRDPRDVAISLAHHSGINIDEAIDQMNDENFAWTISKRRLSHFLPQVMFSWSQHVESWLDHSGQSPLLLRYEDMLADPMECVRRVCAQLEWKIEQSVLEAAVDQTRFDRLAGQEKDGGFKERSAPNRVFFRQGRAGGWRDVLSRAQTDLIEKKNGAVMERLGYF